MKSPFPGMDPYLEARWGDVHTSLAAYTRNYLQRQLPRDLRARVEEQVLVEEEDDTTAERHWKPDVRIVERPVQPASETPPTDRLAVAEPLVVEWDEVPEIERSVRIIDVGDGNRVVTVIEFLSPTNKNTRRGRTRYRRKQRDFLEASVNLVEIDLVRQGGYVLAAPQTGIPADYLEPYRVCVSRGGRPGQAELYRVSLRVALPTIRIPLRDGDADVALDLQAIVNEAYATGGYDDIDYSRNAEPPLAGDDDAWADALLRHARKRGPERTARA